MNLLYPILNDKTRIAFAEFNNEIIDQHSVCLFPDSGITADTGAIRPNVRYDAINLTHHSDLANMGIISAMDTVPSIVIAGYFFPCNGELSYQEVIPAVNTHVKMLSNPRHALKEFEFTTDRGHTFSLYYNTTMCSFRINADAYRTPAFNIKIERGRIGHVSDIIKSTPAQKDHNPPDVGGVCYDDRQINKS